MTPRTFAERIADDGACGGRCELAATITDLRAGKAADDGADDALRATQHVVAVPAVRVVPVAPMAPMVVVVTSVPMVAALAARMVAAAVVVVPMTGPVTIMVSIVMAAVVARVTPCTVLVSAAAPDVDMVDASPVVATVMTAARSRVFVPARMVAIAVAAMVATGMVAVPAMVGVVVARAAMSVIMRLRGARAQGKGGRCDKCRAGGLEVAPGAGCLL